jgi:hypothetical protein
LCPIPLGLASGTEFYTVVVVIAVVVLVAVFSAFQFFAKKE